MRLLTTILLTLLCLPTMAQRDTLPTFELVMNVADMLPEQVEVVGTTQGFAIYGRYGFSMHDKGQCVIIDLKKNQFVTTFTIEGNTGHCNNASFGVERYSRESQFPLFYVTECRGERACYVNDISLSEARMVQKIFYDGEDATGPADWVVDAKHKLIYLYCTIDNRRTLKYFPLPTLAQSDANGEVHLTAEDALGELFAGPITIPQGSHIKARTVFLPDGVPPRPTRLHLTDIGGKREYQPLDVSHLELEPEGVATRRGWLYISFHTPRDVRRNIIYRVKVNHLRRAMSRR